MNTITHINNLLPPSAATVPSRGTMSTAASTSSTTGAAGSTAPVTASNLLDPNSFITLLTTQLQAQDPTNPLDPDQMVNELMSMNTLQQTIQIQQDLATLVSDASAVSGTGGAGTTSG